MRLRDPGKKTVVCLFHGCYQVFQEAVASTYPGVGKVGATVEGKFSRVEVAGPEYQACAVQATLYMTVQP